MSADIQTPGVSELLHSCARRTWAVWLQRPTLSPAVCKGRLKTTDRENPQGSGTAANHACPLLGPPYTGWWPHTTFSNWVTHYLLDPVTWTSPEPQIPVSIFTTTLYAIFLIDTSLQANSSFCHTAQRDALHLLNIKRLYGFHIVLQIKPKSLSKSKGLNHLPQQSFWCHLPPFLPSHSPFSREDLLPAPHWATLASSLPFHILVFFALV